MFSKRELQILGMEGDRPGEDEPSLTIRAFSSTAFADFVNDEQASSAADPKADDDMRLKFDTMIEALDFVDMLSKSGGLRQGQFTMRERASGDGWLVVVEAGSLIQNPFLLSRIRREYSQNEIRESKGADPPLMEGIGFGVRRDLVEMNPHHAADDGKFTNKPAINNRGAGSYSRPNKKKMYYTKGKDSPRPRIQNKTCGRDAREAGGDVRCHDGAEKKPMRANAGTAQDLSTSWRTRAQDKKLKALKASGQQLRNKTRKDKGIKRKKEEDTDFDQLLADVEALLA